MSCYTSISEFGASAQGPTSNPLSVCAVSGIDAGFNNKLGYGMLNPDGEQCQRFMAQYAATVGWDPVCEYKSKDTNKTYPSMVMQNCGSVHGGSCLGSGLGSQLTGGQTFIRNAAAEKYLVAVSDNCRREYEPFDPTDASSPLISRWVNRGSNCSSGNCNSYGNKCRMVYDVEASKINNDPLMNKILAQPWIAMDILANIYNTRKRHGTLGQLNHTKLGHFFHSKKFQEVVNSGAL